MKRIYKNIALAALMLAPAVTSAQNTYSGYFLDNYLYRYEMNPALLNMDDHGFVGFPVLGNLNVGMQGNLHVSDILYPSSKYDPSNPNKTLLFSNPNIPAKDVLKHLSNTNILGVDTKIDLISVGFKAFGGQNAVTLSAVANAQVGAPKSLFSLIKEGVSNKTYDIKNFRLNATGYAQLQLNHQRDLSEYLPGLKAGAAFKMLFGLANIDAYFNRAHLELGTDGWTGLTNADIYMSMKGAKYTTSYNEDAHREYVDGLDVNSFGITGFGIGFDLGATYKWKDFNFSLALLDLGFISWSDVQYASTEGDRTVNTDAYTFQIGDKKDENGNKLENDTWDDFKNNISDLYQLSYTKEGGSRTRGLRATLNWGVDYEFPYYRNLHFGMVNTTTFNHLFTATEFRFSANVQPVKCFSASANLAAGTFGAGFGWLLNLNLKGFSFFLGMDHTLGKLAKQGIPLNSNAEVNLGINFPF
ncbi:MAG: hypothetical protein K2M03_04695 [Muribaculaceae bacterium]|nr:hypothetical protein [Muribaculaceae bacterium]